ncbi:MAG: NAD-dependent deacylase [Planctomycetes bacterium]|nr:NAD-dependent deacylase [Planctomycetota bacterium]
MDDLPAQLLDALRKARRVAVLTGAGISAESGVPTFRDAQTGLWAKYEPTQLATPEAFARDPRLVWEWYAWRRELCSAAKPNAGHLALVELEKRFADFTLTTQNVDGLHLLAGSRRVLELHGSIRRYKCFDTGRLLEGEPPHCDNPPPRHPQTGGMLRPDVVWFGEALPEAALMESLRAAREADIYLTIGTSALVYPAAALPIEAQRAGATVVEINPTETPCSKFATFSLRGKAGEVLPAIVQALGE